MIGIGISSSMADLILEMAAGLNSGHMAALEVRSARNTTPTSFETFVKEEFVPLYYGKSAPRRSLRKAQFRGSELQLRHQRAFSSGFEPLKCSFDVSAIS